MQKLIKLSDTHYVVVDDSEIKEGDISIMKDGGKYKINPYPINNEYNLKITHSTKPLEEDVVIMGSIPKITLRFLKIKKLSLSDVEEVINGYSVEKMAKYHYGNHRKTREFEDGFMLGFQIAHKELVKDKLFTVEDMRRELRLITTEIATEDGELSSCSPSLIFSWIENKIQSLLPKTEWNCKVVNGKIELI